MAKNPISYHIVDVEKMLKSRNFQVHETESQQKISRVKNSLDSC